MNPIAVIDTLSERGIYFDVPVLLYFVVFAFLAGLLYIYGTWRRRLSVATVFKFPLRQSLVQTNRPKTTFRALCVITAIVLLGIALGLPQWGTRLQDVDRKGRDFLILLDVSISMLAEDASPTRLESAREGIETLVAEIRKDGGHRVALIAFAGRASPAIPLTVDYDLFLNRLDEIDASTSVRHGSHIGDAIRQALYGFGPLSHEFTDIILLSDGEDHGSAPDDAAKVAAGLGVAIHSFGIGDAVDGATIPYTPDGSGGNLKLNNTEIISRMQPGILVELARITKGEFVSAGVDRVNLDDFYKRNLSKKPTRQIDVVARERRVHRFQWFVGAALALLVIEILLTLSGPKSKVTRHVTRTYAAKHNTAIAGASVICAFALTMALTTVANSNDALTFSKTGYDLFQKGDFHGAANEYQRTIELQPESPVAHFNYATTRFKLYDYASAIEHFAIALNGADPPLESRINYNLGVVKHQQAIGNLMTFQDAMSALTSAIDYYHRSLELDPSLPDTRYNLELAHRLSEEIRNQRVLPQANARTRDQKTSDNKGQLGNEQGDRATNEMPDQGAQEQQQSNENPSGQTTMSQQTKSSQNQSSQAQSGEATDINLEEAMQKVELARERADTMSDQRYQWRQARMMDDKVEKIW